MRVKTLDELATLLREKLDLGCLNVMSQASLLANQETNNLEYVKGNDSIMVCLWGNLSKNPRFVFMKTYIILVVVGWLSGNTYVLIITVALHGVQLVPVMLNEARCSRPNPLGQGHNFGPEAEARRRKPRPVI